MAATDPAGAAMAVLVTFEIPNMYSGLLPSLFTISTFAGGDPDKAAHAKKWIRIGELQATAMSLIVAAAAAVISKSALPFIGALLMVVYLLWQYEKALSGASSGPQLDMVAGAT